MGSTFRAQIDGHRTDPPDRASPPRRCRLRRILTLWTGLRSSRGRDKCAGPGARAALVGLGGVGMSQLAIQYAHSIRDASPHTFVFWVHANTRARFEEAYRDIADRLQLPGRSDPKANVLWMARDWLQDEASGRRNGAVLITSQNKDTATRLAGGFNKTKEVLALDESEGLQLLRNKLRDLLKECRSPPEAGQFILQ
ncbi:hypothetical protein PMIN04_012295 [Paraphaeosphaeria minitans]